MKEEVKTWIDKAEDDLEKAEILFDNKKYDGAAFYCQQAIEKAFKALLIKKTENFPKIHDLVKLAEIAKSPQDIKESCSKIEPAYISSRYPDLAKKYTLEETKETLKCAKKVLIWIKKNLD